jgi:hypothetical protein
MEFETQFIIYGRYFYLQPKPTISQNEKCSRREGICIKNKTVEAFIVLYVKSKAVPLHAMEAHGGREGIAPTHT